MCEGQKKKWRSEEKKVRVVIMETDSEDFHGVNVQEDENVLVLINGNDSKEIQMQKFLNEMLRVFCTDYREIEEFENDAYTVDALQKWLKLNEYGREEVLSFLELMADAPEYTKADIIPFPGKPWEE